MAIAEGKLTLGVSAASAELLQRELGGIKGAGDAALASAVNDTLVHARAEIVKAVREDLNLPAGEVRDRVEITKKATAGVAMGEITISWKPVPLIEFKPRPSSPPKHPPKRGVVVTTVKGKPALAFKHLFVAQMPSGHIGVFGRKGNDRTPIKQAMGPAVTTSFEKAPGLAAAIMEDIEQTLETKLASKIDWQLAKRS